MGTITAGNSTSFAMTAGQYFTISKAASSEGTFKAVTTDRNPNKDQGVFGNTTLNAKQYGPYDEDTTVTLACAVGSITYAGPITPGSGGGSVETTNTISSGGTVTLAATTPGTPINYVITTTAAVIINVPTTNAGSPGGRVNIVDATGNPNVTIAAATGNIAGVASLSLFGSADAYNSYNLYDYGTGWALQ